MSAAAIAISGAGLVTSVGLDCAAACAALRCRLNNFLELDFLDHENEPVIGAPVPWSDLGTGMEKLAQMAAAAITQALAPYPEIVLADTPILLCLAEPERAGRMASLESGMVAKLARWAGHWHADSRTVAQGQVAVANALPAAQQLILERGHAAVLIVAADTYTHRNAILSDLDQERLLASDIRAAFIPGEAAGALLVRRADGGRDVELKVYGQGSALEAAHRDSELPLRADGLSAAITEALREANAEGREVDLCLSDANGEDYRFEELAMAQQRTGCATPLWLPAESLGEIGSVTGCVQFAWLLEAQKKYYMPGNNALCLMGNDTGQRSATLVAFEYSPARREAIEASSPAYKKSDKQGVKHGT